MRMLGGPSQASRSSRGIGTGPTRAHLAQIALRGMVTWQEFWKTRFELSCVPLSYVWPINLCQVYEGEVTSIECSMNRSWSCAINSIDQYFLMQVSGNLPCKRLCFNNSGAPNCKWSSSVQLLLLQEHWSLWPQPEMSRWSCRSSWSVLSNMVGLEMLLGDYSHYM